MRNKTNQNITKNKRKQHFSNKMLFFFDFYSIIELGKKRKIGDKLKSNYNKVMFFQTKFI